MDDIQYLLVDARVLPEALIKVVQAKRLLAQGKARSLSEATRMAGISRSAFYKYKDSVFTYDNSNTRQVVTLYAQLVDEAGVLSSLLAALGGEGGNILTINQNIPVDGVAPVSISLRCDNMSRRIEEVAAELRNLKGIVDIRLLTT